MGKRKPEKNQGFNGIQTRDLRVTGALLYQLSYEATSIVTSIERLRVTFTANSKRQIKVDNFSK